MKRITGILALLLGLFLLAGCSPSAPQGTGDPPDTSQPGTSAPLEESGGAEGEITSADPPVSARFRIVDGAESGQLLLAALDENSFGSVFSLNLCEMGVLLDGELADSTALEDGMVIRVTWQDSGILETYPAQLSGVRSIEAWSLGSEQNPGGGYYDLCGLYLQVLNDLWEEDSALNEGKSVIALDLTQAPGGLTDSEKAALAWRFGELHGADVLLSTFDQLKEEGALTEQITENGNTLYSWEDGCLFSIESHATDQEELYSLPVLRFDAAKWRGPLAAYFFYDCTAVWPELGTWTGYSVGAEMIS